MRDAATNRTAIAAINSRKSTSALIKLSKQLETASAEIEELKKQLTGIVTLPDDYPVFV